MFSFSKVSTTIAISFNTIIACVVNRCQSNWQNPFNCHESLLWEGFVTPIYVDRRAHLFPIMRSENRKLNGSDQIGRIHTHAAPRARKRRGTGTSPNTVCRNYEWTLFHYHITVPPVLMSCPVIFAESSDARKTANAAASSDPEPLSL